MKIRNKELVSSIIDTLDEDGVFEASFLDKGRFKVILSKRISECENPMAIIDDIVSNSIDDCIRTAIDTTLDSLTEANLVETAINENGELTYKLKQ